MLGLKLIHVSKSGPWKFEVVAFCFKNCVRFVELDSRNNVGEIKRTFLSSRSFILHHVYISRMFTTLEHHGDIYCKFAVDKSLKASLPVFIHNASLFITDLFKKDNDITEWYISCLH